MTRKATRKKRRQAARQALAQPRTRVGAPWMTVGALIATSAVTGLRPVPLSAFVPRQPDPRLALIDTVLRSSADPYAPTASRPAYQDRDTQSSTVRRYDVPPGPLSDVATAFERV